MLGGRLRRRPRAGHHQRSGYCLALRCLPVGARTLLMATGDKDVQTITWHADRSQESCQPDEKLPLVDAGSYKAKLVLKADSNVVSQPVPVMIQ